MSTDKNTKQAIEAGVFKRLLKHLDDNKEVQNIDLMVTGKFCRNCLSKWYVTEAAAQGVSLDYEEARELVYGMPYAEYKAKHQTEASPEKLAKFNNK